MCTSLSTYFVIAKTQTLQQKQAFSVYHAKCAAVLSTNFCFNGQENAAQNRRIGRGGQNTQKKNEGRDNGGRPRDNNYAKEQYNNCAIAMAQCLTVSRASFASKRLNRSSPCWQYMLSIDARLI